MTGAHGEFVPGVYALLQITDTGTGMDEHTRKHLFEPFFTTKAEGKGTGLGLATVYGIVKQHEGLISVESEPGRGTTFQVYLPAARDQTPEQESPDTLSGDFRGSETILLVEDDGRVRRLARTILFRQGYRVLDAPDGETALALLEGGREDPDLLLTDVVMPGMNGKVLADKVSEICPKVSVLYMSGYTDEAIVDQRGFLKGVDLLQKPFSVSSLVTKVREVLDEEGPGET
jgi:CheY-like chemotaxis protein